jgi:xanthine dehydrogenase molybdopterin-binding subunit B
MVHIDNAYYIPHIEVRGRIAKTNKTSNTAFRGFGGPQGMVVIEDIMDRIARAISARCRRANAILSRHGRNQHHALRTGNLRQSNRARLESS